MTLLAKRRVTYYYRCLTEPKKHRFQRAKPDVLKWCPTCGGHIRMYGLADSTAYEPIPESPEDHPPD